ncbi:XrtB/PEP-CTERM-associated transcriptional regulator EpsA [Azovibrio restrictus]|uniref:XrtB/PEP-CTERM-associated transcriptional regulator EpsA n=1 Tax=Azovibrio restrictus TaxID=146938 RepID=UPI0026EEC7BC|nr:XrtB/PEP-CTERM-associated transcriptional regulator EpsA [Azovibrio restrictus]MDD3481302.1 LuxR C-terminal-related transcriptional regulator [Azovibrio restrictus]
MTFSAHLSVGELAPLLKALHKSFAIQRHYELLNWLQDDIQHFLPHKILVAAWGDFASGQLCHDIVSPLPEIRTGCFADQALQPLMQELFHNWSGHGHNPFYMPTAKAFPNDSLQGLHGHGIHAALIHGIHDQRSRNACLYVLLDQEDVLRKEGVGETLRFLLPYIDTAFRQIGHLPSQYIGTPHNATSVSSGKQQNPACLGLSAREMDIMEWVRMGKTNQEIGMILNISAFTVKNHLQRIFKKLDAMNRAQAVGLIEAAQRQACK